MTKKKYSIILADPPWSYKDKAASGKRGAEFKYPCMDLEAIKDLPVASMAADDALLFLWITFPFLPHAEELMKAWGFEYKTLAFNWVKTNKKQTDTLFWGMGNWTRSNSELCLLGIRGKPKRVSKSVHSVIQSPIGKHSRKPAEVRDRIIELCGDLPRIELFSTETVEGWDRWGNMVESSVDLMNVQDERVDDILKLVPPLNVEDEAELRKHLRTSPLSVEFLKTVVEKLQEIFGDKGFNPGLEITVIDSDQELLFLVVNPIHYYEDAAPLMDQFKNWWVGVKKAERSGLCIAMGHCVEEPGSSVMTVSDEDFDKIIAESENPTRKLPEKLIKLMRTKT
jgi:N6-adenosine-specific RNA methylase IME4